MKKILKGISISRLAKISFVVAILALIFSIVAIFGNDSWRPKSEADSFSDKKMIQNYNQLTISQLKQYKKDKKAETLTVLKKNLETRQNKMAKMAGEKPEDFLLLSMPTTIRNEFPSDLKGLIEEKTEVTGEMEVMAWDNPDNKTAGVYNKVVSGDKTYDLYFADKVPDLETGTKVKVNGERINQSLVTFAASKGDLGLQTVSVPVAPPALSIRKGAIILFNFANSTSQPFNLDNLKTTAYGTANSTDTYWQEATYGKIGLQGDGFGPYTIPISTDGICTDAAAPWLKWEAQANTAAAANGFLASNYNHIMYVFPSQGTGCGWSGIGYIGGTRTFYNGYFSQYLNVHELGHNLSFRDVYGYKCKDTLGNYVPLSSTCTAAMYEDYGEPMGDSLRHHQGYFKVFKGWMPTANVQTVTASGTYTIAPLEQLATTPQLLKVPSGITGRSYYLSARNDYGVDRNFWGNAYQTGMAIRLGTTTPSGTGSWLIDMIADGDMHNAPLVVGQTFTDPFTNTTIKLVSKDMTQATVEVNLGAPVCVKVNPITTIEPVTGPTVAAGAPVNYTVTVSNQNSGACPTENFSLTKVLPSGWTGTFANPTLNLASGAYAKTTFTVTSLATNIDGSYPIEVTSAIASDMQYYSRANATYWIYTTSPADWTVAVRTDKPVYAAGESIVMVADVLYQGKKMSGTTVDFTLSGPNGVVATKTGVSVDRKGFIQWKYKLSRRPVRGTYTVQAAGKYNGQSVGINQATFTVN